MIILTLRTDKPEAEIGLFDGDKQLAYETWAAHRQLAETIHIKIREILADNSKDWPDIQAIVVYEGPGSFTGLRIGLAVANTIAYGLNLPIVGTTGDDWAATGLSTLLNGGNDNQVMPEYGAPVHITAPRK